MSLSNFLTPLLELLNEGNPLLKYLSGILDTKTRLSVLVPLSLDKEKVSKQVWAGPGWAAYRHVVFDKGLHEQVQGQ